MPDITYVFYNFAYNLLTKKISDLSDNTNTHIKVMLISNVPDLNTWNSKVDVTGEITGTGYIAGGQELTNKLVTKSQNITIFTADNILWSNSTLLARCGVIYDDTPASDSDKKLISYVDFGGIRETSDSNFRIIWSSNGIFKLPA